MSMFGNGTDAPTEAELLALELSLDEEEAASALEDIDLFLYALHEIDQDKDYLDGESEEA